MNKNIIFAVLAITLVACSPGINDANEALNEIQGLDAKYGTNYSQEQVNKLMLTRPNIEAYLQDLEGLKANVKAENEKQERWIGWLFEFRKQMLESQHYFQQAWIGIGEVGRVSDGFKCSEISAIRETTELLEKSWRVGLNSTLILDSLMTESEEMRNRIGVGDDKPQIYNSNFERILLEARSNVIGMKKYCDLDVPTTYINVTDELEDLEVMENGTQRT